ncbi:chitin-binding type-2 domain-containing protein [Trichonephila inaurata madagascariensis]|uniref:Chitin-binding type-2 domain-containing protein n=1 Tax=Trichonephila inaurata madagascariensis TaxID=2747483 RepID=A0A8X6XBR7_9ARAC|nr:chitin-binding type-2 domain-containing protein [Trichonephila inaurata madagascariensis]
MVKALKKKPLLSRTTKTKKKSTDQEKSESYHVPIIISAPEAVSREIPVSLELHDDDRYLKSAADVHPIRPIHLVPVGGQYRPSQHQEPVYHGPVAVPQDYPYGGSQLSGNTLSSEEYYPPGDLSAIPGNPGVDYPVYSHLPETGFKCLAHTSTPGFYADVETKCQMWHYCQPDGRHDRFLCPNGTVFDQMTRVCNWWFNVFCDDALNHYDINFDLYREPKKVVVSQSYHPLSSQPETTISTPNSFLGHVRDFEAGLLPVPRYPEHMAPTPFVRHDAIDYDSSNAHSLSAPLEKLKLKLIDDAPLKKKRIARRKLKKHPKIRREENDIPTYREPKATPAARKYRVVRRRKVNRA